MEREGSEDVLWDGERKEDGPAAKVYVRLKWLSKK